AAPDCSSGRSGGSRSSPGARSPACSWRAPPAAGAAARRRCSPSPASRRRWRCWRSTWRAGRWGDDPVAGPGELFVIGVSWRTAPVAVRERLAFRDDELDRALGDLLGSPSVEEAVILSTCNRVEIYGCTAPSAPGARLASAAAEARSFLARSRGVAAEGLADQLFEHVEDGAVRHLFRVASALDSMVIGESQILGQLKDAYGAAVRAQATGPVLARSM